MFNGPEICAGDEKKNKKKQKYGCVYTERKPSRAETFVTGTIIAAATVYLTFFFF